MRSAISIASASAGDAVDEHGELVAAEPGEHLTAADAPTKAFRDLDQHLVAQSVPEGVVDLLEPVEVQEQEGERRPVARRASTGLLRVLRERGSVPQTGERVVQRIVAELLLELALLGDVVHVDHDGVAPLARWVGERRRNPAGRAVAVPEREEVDRLRAAGVIGQAVDEVQQPLDLTGAHDRADRARDDLLRRVPEQGLHRRAREHHVPVARDDRDDIDRVLQQGQELLAAVSQRILRILGRRGLDPEDACDHTEADQTTDRDRVRQAGVDERRRPAELDRGLPQEHPDDAPREARAPARGAGFLQHHGEPDAVGDDEHRSPADRIDHRGGRQRRHAEPHLDPHRLVRRTPQPHDRRQVARRGGEEQEREHPERRVGDPSLGAEPPDPDPGERHRREDGEERAPTCATRAQRRRALGQPRWGSILGCGHGQRGSRLDARPSTRTVGDLSHRRGGPDRG